MSLGRLRLAALFLAALAMALIAGFFYAYACSVMVGLAQLDAAGFVRAMQAINATVRNGAFAFSFFGAFLFTAIAALLYLPCRRERAARLVLAALALYTLGAFVVTFAFNVPLNEALARAPDLAAPADFAEARRAYVGPWTRWNLVRTLASTGAFLTLSAAIFFAGRDARGRQG